MKRSEMIDVIGEYLATDGVVMQTCITLDEMANDILNLIEKAGMYPPKVQIKEYESGVYYKDRFWEPEDE